MQREIGRTKENFLLLQNFDSSQHMESSWKSRGHCWLQMCCPKKDTGMHNLKQIKHQTTKMREVLFLKRDGELYSLKMSISKKDKGGKIFQLEGD